MEDNNNDRTKGKREDLTKINLYYKEYREIAERQDWKTKQEDSPLQDSPKKFPIHQIATPEMKNMTQETTITHKSLFEDEAGDEAWDGARAGAGAEPEAVDADPSSSR